MTSTINLKKESKLTQEQQKALQSYIYQKVVLASGVANSLIEGGSIKSAKLILTDLDKIIKEYEELTQLP